MLLAALILVALIFDFLNGLHDAANSIATVVSTRVLSPDVAVVWAAFFNFIAFMFFGLHVAQTIGTGIISPDIVDGQVIFGALMGAIVWNLLTWWGAIPSSSSHALIGGLIGAGAAKAGFSAVVWWGTLKTLAAIVWSPLLGFALALLLWLVVAWLLMRSKPFAVDQKFRVLQRCSENHGDHCQPPLRARSPRLRFLCSLLGGVVLPISNGTGHAYWRMAHRKDHGIKDYSAEAGARVLCRDGGSDDALSGDQFRCSRVYNAHDHRRDHGRGGSSQGFSGSLGDRWQHCHGVDHHNPRSGHDCRAVLCVRDLVWRGLRAQDT
jgi:phosphate/sulfate permease